jgi:hypothetical protein
MMVTTIISSIIEKPRALRFVMPPVFLSRMSFELAEGGLRKWV